MCGIAGLLSRDPERLRQVHRMIGLLRHRGPDDGGEWIDMEAGVAFGHRRLSIIDLSPHGHQPMASADGRYVLTYNGEIYNHAALRSRLEDQGRAPRGGWRGHSDTETLLQAIACYGVEQALTECAGMFAFGLWDKRERELVLGRDRFGEKPLYYGWIGGDFLFASELKAFEAHPGFNKLEINRDAVQTLIERTYIPAPMSIYSGVFKLPPAALLRVNETALRHPRRAALIPGESGEGLALSAYWSYAEVLRAGASAPIGDEAEAIESLEAVLGRAVQEQASADVAVGAFLSGGLDSSTIVALYQKFSSTPARTFTIGFHEQGFNEAEAAKAVARHLGTVHHECYVTAKAAQDVIPQLPTMYDEPFADSSQIPTHLVSRFAKSEVTVALTGDGGDELFGGYSRYSGAMSLWKAVHRVPLGVRRTAAAAFRRVPATTWNRIGRAAGRANGARWGSRIEKALRVTANARSFEQIYASTLHQWPYEPCPTGHSRDPTESFPLDLLSEQPEALRAMHCDALAYLPDDILCKVDRASMAVSLETRVPFLDHRVAALAARIPMHMKLSGSKGKLIIRKLLGRELPAKLFERPKTGFALPVGDWLKCSLRSWAEELLDPKAMNEQGWFDVAIVQERWQQHLSGRRDSTEAIWTILMFQAWLRNSRYR